MSQPQRVGRPPKEVRARAGILTIRALFVEMDHWRRAARAAGKSVSEWARDLMNAASGRTPPESKP